MRAFLRAHNIDLNIFFDDAEEAREFAKDKVYTSYYFMAVFPEFLIQGMNHQFWSASVYSLSIVFGFHNFPPSP